MASTYLTRTVSSASNRRTWTWSAWIKRGVLTGNQALFTSRTDNSNYSTIRLEPDRFHIFDLVSGGFNHQVKTNRRLRDVNGWYHLVVAFDTTQATASDRIKMYVNGEQETSLAESSYPAQNYEGFINRNRDHYIGQGGNQGDKFDGSMSHINFVDGTALTPSSFGETDSTTGEWKIKTSPSVTYGTEGFFILKDGNSVTDQSGQSNNWSVGGGTLTKTEDCPSNVFATLNTLTRSASQLNIVYGNNKKSNTPTSNSWRSIASTLGASTGKYYFEVRVDNIENSDPNNFAVGITDYDQSDNQSTTNGKFFAFSRGYGYHAMTGKKLNNDSVTDNGAAYGSSWTTNDIIGCAFDLDNGKIYFSKNGTWQDSGDPTSGSTGTGSAFNITTGYTYFPVMAQYYGNEHYSFNFGNGVFGNGVISSAGTNASNLGIFEYDVPSGYTALCTKGLNE